MWKGPLLEDPAPSAYEGTARKWTARLQVQVPMKTRMLCYVTILNTIKRYVNLNTNTYMKVVLSQLFDTHISLNEVLDLLDLLRVRLLGQLARQLLALVRPDLVDELVAVPK